MISIQISSAADSLDLLLFSQIQNLDLTSRSDWPFLDPDSVRQLTKLKTLKDLVRSRKPDLLQLNCKDFCMWNSAMKMTPSSRSIDSFKTLLDCFLGAQGDGSHHACIDFQVRKSCAQLQARRFYCCKIRMALSSTLSSKLFCAVSLHE